MRGAFDFETFGWAGGEEVRPLSCGFAWGPPGKRETAWFHDASHMQSNALGEQALKFMFVNKDVKEWWAHNLGRFDGLFLLAAAVRLRWKVKGILAGEGRIIGIEFWPPGSKRRVKTFDTDNLTSKHSKTKGGRDEVRPVRVYDTFNLVPTSLGHKGSKEDCKKKGGCCACDFELPSAKAFNEAAYDDMRKLSVEDLKEGNLTDCFLVLELLEKMETLVEDWGGELRKTFSSSALSIVKADLKERGMELPNFQRGGNNLNSLFESAYYGARVEVLHHCPEELLKEYDINSSYPAAMAQPVPWEYLGKSKSSTDIKRRLAAGEPMLVKATVTIPKMWLPPLPHKIEDDPESGVFFPIGTWTGWFPSVEIDYALGFVGVKAEFLEAHVFTEESPFTSFINQVYELKKTSTGSVRQFSKYVLNGCYGKFGEKPDHENLIVFEDENEALDYAFNFPGKCRQLCPDFDGRFYAVKYTRWSKHAHYGIAAFITARARIAIHRALCESIDPAYTDSDSIHCVDWGGKVSNELGGMKLELENYLGQFFAPKIYRLVEPNVIDLRTGKPKQHFACKGFPVNAKDFQTMLESAWDRRTGVAKEKRRKVVTDRMRLIRSQLKASDASQVMRVTTQKTWGGYSMKRKPKPNGETTPWTVEELREGVHKKAVSPLLARLEASLKLG